MIFLNIFDKVVYLDFWPVIIVYICIPIAVRCRWLTPFTSGAKVTLWPPFEVDAEPLAFLAIFRFVVYFPDHVITPLWGTLPVFPSSQLTIYLTYFLIIFVNVKSMGREQKALWAYKLKEVLTLDLPQVKCTIVLSTILLCFNISRSGKFCCLLLCCNTWVVNTPDFLKARLQLLDITLCSVIFSIHHCTSADVFIGSKSVGI